MMVGLIKPKDPNTEKFKKYAAWTAVGIVLFILFNQLLPWGWYSFIVFPDSDWLAVILGLLVAGLIIYFTLRPGGGSETEEEPAAPAGGGFKLVPDFGKRRR